MFLAWQGRGRELKRVFKSPSPEVTLLQIEDQNLIKWLNDLPSPATWAKVMPIAKPELGKIVTYVEKFEERNIKKNYIIIDNHNMEHSNLTH